MLKKYNISYSIPFKFLNFALSMIMCYTLSVTMFLSMPPEGMTMYEVVSMAIEILDSIFCSLAVTSVFFFVISMLTTYYKK